MGKSPPENTQSENTEPEMVDIAALQGALLRHYHQHARILPWRVAPDARANSDKEGGQRPDPYHVLLSEYMLQQTTVATVRGRFADFLAACPTIEALAALDEGQVLGLWAGLGYYARARNLHKAAKYIAQNGWPQDYAGLRGLPGVGAYIGKAVGAIAFDWQLTPIDANVARIFARVFMVEVPLNKAQKPLEAIAAKFDGLPQPGNFAQALMDLGANICTNGAPKCDQCPIVSHCGAARAGRVDELPVKSIKAQRPTRTGWVVIHQNGDNILMVRRPPKGLLGAMFVLPSSGWEDGQAAEMPSGVLGSARLLGHITHIFTHFRLELDVYVFDVAPIVEVGEGIWLSRTDLATAPIPTVTQKALGVWLAHAD